MIRTLLTDFQCEQDTTPSSQLNSFRHRCLPIPVAAHHHPYLHCCPRLYCYRCCRLRPAAGREALNSSPRSLPVNHYAKVHPRLEHFLCKLRHFKRTVNVIADAERHLGPLQCLQCDKQHTKGGEARLYDGSHRRCAGNYCSPNLVMLFVVTNRLRTTIITVHIRNTLT